MIPLSPQRFTLNSPQVTGQLRLRLGKFGEETDFKKPVTARLKEKAGRGTGKYYHEMQLLTRFLLWCSTVTLQILKAFFRV